MSASLDPPRLVSDTPEPGWGASYRLVYALRGPPGAWIVQQVEAEVRYLHGDEVLASYTGCYGEWFRLDADGELPASLHDVHDFCVHRDAWTPKRLRDLLAREGLLGRRQRLPGGAEPRVECFKRFLLGAGEVDDGAATVEVGGAAFGFLAQGPDQEPRAGFALCLGEGRRQRSTPPQPFGRPARGLGRFRATVGWEAEERFSYRFASGVGQLASGGYQPAPLP